MDGTAALYASVAALLYVLAEILKAMLQTWREKRAERKRAWREKEAAEKVAAKVEEVKEVLETTTANQNLKLDSIVKTTDDTLIHVNSTHGAALKLNAELSRWKADQTHLTQDIAAAVTAEKAYGEHMGKQSIVDKKTEYESRDR